MTYSDDFYKDFGLTKLPKEYLDKQELFNLFKKPLKETKNDMPRFYNFEENDTHQADVLYLPKDGDYSYCLVITDIATAKTDAEPLKGLASKEILQASKVIYRHGILKIPKKLITDSGGEFKAEFADFYKKKNVLLKTALAGRHRQIALVERKNQIIGKVLFMRMYAQELLTHQVSTEWVSDLPFVIKKMNDRYSHPVYTDEDLFKRFNPWKDLKQEMIPLGANVRVKLDEPRDIANSKLHGKFRESDQRWTKEIYQITNYRFDPHQPILYEINKPLKPNEKVTYTAKQLQVVDENEQDPSLSVIRGNPEYYAVKKLIGKRIRSRKVQYLVWWKGYPQSESTWQNASDLPELPIKIFESLNN